jgi:hypothetical protein
VLVPSSHTGTWGLGCTVVIIGQLFACIQVSLPQVLICLYIIHSTKCPRTIRFRSIENHTSIRGDRLTCSDIHHHTCNDKELYSAGCNYYSPVIKCASGFTRYDTRLETTSGSAERAFGAPSICVIHI